MNKTWAAIAAGVVVIAAGAVAVAIAADWGDGPRKGRHGKGHGRGQAMHLLQFDTDKDGRITRAEVDAGITAQFTAADTNADSKLDPAEFQKYNDARKAERKARIEAWRAKRGTEGGEPKRDYSDRGPRNFDPMKNMDWNLDGFISLEEFAGRTRAQAMRADRDGDGTILAEDLTKRGKFRRGGEPSAPAATAPTP
jgi:hypothetical protein